MAQDRLVRTGRAIPLRPFSYTLIAFLILSLACGRGEGALAVAERFMEHYYVLADLQGAKRFTTGLADEKIQEQVKLTAGSVADAEARSREVSFTLLEKQEQEGKVFLVYEVTVVPRGGTPFKKRSFLSLGLVGGAWKVTNFRDLDA